MWRGIAWGVTAGVCYAFLTWFVFAASGGGGLVGDVMSFTFLFVEPFVIGLVTMWVADKQGRGGPDAFVWPIFAVLIAAGIALLFQFEGVICLVMLIPVWTLLAAAGGALGVSIRRTAHLKAQAKQGQTLVVCALVLPFVLGPVEQRLPLSDDLRTVTSSIEIQASPERVWPEIARVRRITPEEHEFRWVHLIGFPRPVEATLSHDGVGGVRHASFEGGVVFVETVDIWQPGKRLGFSIHADPDSIPAKTLDEHVTVGGPYFDVLHGEYLIEPLPNGRVRLVLTSHHRLSTHFNFYAKWWTDFVMADIQEEILVILKRRCEAPAK